MMSMQGTNQIIKLFTIPYSGGNAYSFSEFKKHLPNNIELRSLELPGRGKRIQEQTLNNIQDMTSDLFKQMDLHYGERYAIYGHSLGALLAFTLCRLIESKGMNLPLALFVSGQLAPSRIKPDHKYRLPDNEFIDMLRDMGGTPDELLMEDSFVKYFLPIIRKDFQSIAHYKYSGYETQLNIPIKVFIGNKEQISVEDANAWQEESLFPISVFWFDGGHFFIFNNQKELCNIIVEQIK